MVVYYYEAECHAQKWVHYLQCQGHNEGLSAMQENGLTIFNVKVTARACVIKI